MLTNNTLGLIFANMHDSNLGDLTSHRSMASLPVVGRYRMIDFALSSFVNAGITSVGVIAKSNYQSLLDHLESGRSWDMSRKNSGLIIFPPHSYYDSSAVYHGRISALNNIRQYLEERSENYVLMTDCDFICNADYRSIINHHVSSGADVTVVCSSDCNVPIGENDTSSVKYDENGDVTYFSYGPLQQGCVSGTDSFIFNRELLLQILDSAAESGITHLERDVMPRLINKYSVKAFCIDGYVRRINSIRDYFDVSMELVNGDTAGSLFPSSRPVYTKLRDEAPVRYGSNCKVKNSSIADGCIIEGEVENCMLFRSVYVKKGARLKNCIIMQDTVIGENAELDHVIADKIVTIGDNVSLHGTFSDPVLITKKSVITV